MIISTILTITFVPSSRKADTFSAWHAAVPRPKRAEKMMSGSIRVLEKRARKSGAVRLLTSKSPQERFSAIRVPSVMVSIPVKGFQIRVPA